MVLIGRRARELDSTAKEIEAAGGTAAFISADLSDLAGLPGIVERAKAIFGPIDILVNAAGVNLRQAPEEITLESWELTLNLNLATPFFLARELISDMQTSGWGRIINIASLQSSRAFENGLAYGASKGGVAQLTRAMAEAWSKWGINTNAIAPGFFPTGLTAPVYQNAELTAKLATQTAIGRNGALQDLDGITLFLASAASDYVTGQVIYLDGGFTAK